MNRSGCFSGRKALCYKSLIVGGVAPAGPSKVLSVLQHPIAAPAARDRQASVILGSGTSDLLHTQHTAGGDFGLATVGNLQSTCVRIESFRWMENSHRPAARVGPCLKVRFTG